MHTWDRNVPGRIADWMRNQAEVINSPHIGVDSNYAFPAWQLNMAKEQVGSSDK